VLRLHFVELWIHFIVLWLNFIVLCKDIQIYTYKHTKTPTMLHLLLFFAKPWPFALYRNQEKYEYLLYEKGVKQMAGMT